MSMLRPSSNGSGLLALFEESGRNVERTGSLLRDLLDDFPEHSSLARDILICEHEGDRISREAIASLFKSGTDPMVVIRWKDIFESLEQAIDSCETVAHVVEGMKLKSR